MLLKTLQHIRNLYINRIACLDAYPNNYVIIHSFIPDIYIAPLQENYSEALSVRLRSKRNVIYIYIYIYIYINL